MGTTETGDKGKRRATTLSSNSRKREKRKKGTGYFLERIPIMSKIVRGLVDDKGEYAKALV